MDTSPNEPTNDDTSPNGIDTNEAGATPTTAFDAVDSATDVDGTDDTDAASPPLSTEPAASTGSPDGDDSHRRDDVAGSEGRRHRRRSILTGVAAGVVGIGLGAGAFALGSSQLDGHHRGDGHMIEADGMQQGRGPHADGQMQGGMHGGQFGGQTQPGQMQQGGQFGGTGGFQMPQGGGPVQGRTGAS